MQIAKAAGWHFHEVDGGRVSEDVYVCMCMYACQRFKQGIDLILIPQFDPYDRLK